MMDSEKRLSSEVYVTNENIYEKNEYYTYLDGELANQACSQSHGCLLFIESLVDSACIQDSISQIYLLGAPQTDVEICIGVESEKPFFENATKFV